jgi:hypothetical protein
MTKVNFIDFLGTEFSSLSIRHRFGAYLLAAVILTGIFLLVAYGYGPVETPDGRRDLEFSRLLANLDYNLPAFAEKSQQLKTAVDMPQAPISYLLFMLLLHLSDLIAGENWAYALVGINALIATSTALLLIRIGEVSGLSVAGIATIFGFSAFTWEANQWISMSQSEAVFCFVSLITFMVIHRAMTAPSTASAASWWSMALLLAIACQFTRPTSLPVLALLGFVFCFWLVTRNHSENKSRRISLNFIFTLIALICAGIVVHAYIIFDPAIWETPRLRELAEFFHTYHAKGWVVWVRPETYVPPPETIPEYAEISFRRMVYFFWFLADDFSVGHKILNIVAFVPMYFLVIAGLYFGYRSKSGLPHDLIIWLNIALIYILFVDAYHAVTILDFDWRYRAATYPVMWLVAGIGAHCLYPGLRNRRHALQRE